MSSEKPIVEGMPKRPVRNYDATRRRPDETLVFNGPISKRADIIRRTLILSRPDEQPIILISDWHESTNSLGSRIMLFTGELGLTMQALTTAMDPQFQGRRMIGMIGREGSGVAIEISAMRRGGIPAVHYQRLEMPSRRRMGIAFVQDGPHFDALVEACCRVTEMLAASR